MQALSCVDSPDSGAPALPAGPRQDQPPSREKELLETQGPRARGRSAPVATATAVPPEGGNVPAPRRAPTDSARSSAESRRLSPTPTAASLFGVGGTGFCPSCGGRHLPWAVSAEAPPGRPCSRGSSAVRVVKETSAAEGGVPAPGNAGPRRARQPRPTPPARKDILQAFHQQRLPDARGPEQQTHPDPAPGNRGSAPRCRRARLRPALIG